MPFYTPGHKSCKLTRHTEAKFLTYTPLQDNLLRVLMIFEEFKPCKLFVVIRKYKSMSTKWQSSEQNYNDLQ